MKNIFEKELVSPFPLGEASSFFVKLKTAAPGQPFPLGGPPDESGIEGQFTLPLEEVIHHLGNMVESELKSMYAYKAYAESLRGPAHFAISKEFEDHAEKEVEHANWLMRRMSVLGGALHLPDIPAPPASTDVVEILKTMIHAEQEAITQWQQLLEMMGENPSKYDVEQYLADELHHLDELWQMLPEEARGGAPAAPAMESTMGAQPQLPAVNAQMQPKVAAQPLWKRLTYDKTAAAKKDENIEKGEQSAERSLASTYHKHEQTKAERAHGAAGRAAGAVVGGLAGHHFLKHPLATIGAAALGSQLGKEVGKDIGRSSDAAKFKKKHSMAKRAFEEAMNMLGQEQQMQQAQHANEARFYQEKAQQQAQARQQLEQQLQQTQQQAQDAQSQLEQVQSANQQAVDNATRAMTMTVQSNSEAIKHRQLAADTTNAMQSLRQQLRELADGGGSSPPGQPPQSPDAGMQSPQQTAQGPSQEGPAGQANGAGAAPGAAPPEGAQQAGADNSAPSPVESPQSGAQGQPTKTNGEAEPNRTGASGSGVNIKISNATLDTILRIAKERAPYAAGGALLAGGLNAGFAAKGSEGLRQQKEELEAQQGGGFGRALNLAQTKARLAMRELVEENPVASTIAAGGMGAAIGALRGPGLHQTAKDIGKNLAFAAGRS